MTGSIKAEPGQGLSILEFSDALAEPFRRINVEWIEAMFALEEDDKVLLANPRELIVDRGGTVLFAQTPDLGVVGTCALMKMEDGWFELTKMAVTETARGRKVGEFLLAAVLERARSMGIDKLYLLTSTLCGPAVHLYEKLGFEHDPQILQRFGHRYERVNVGMRWTSG
jgi:N-acetylglutamate synthase-like GNAT family acetyltransferase